jgi:hypothetical protein
MNSEVQVMPQQNDITNTDERITSFLDGAIKFNKRPIQALLEKEAQITVSTLLASSQVTEM